MPEVEKRTSRPSIGMVLAEVRKVIREYHETDRANAIFALGRIEEIVRDKRTKAKHGTRSKYQVGCRCPECRAANAAYVRQRRKERARG